jgi:hypothetical protein
MGMEHIGVLSSIEDILSDGECKLYLILKTTSSDTNSARKALFIGLSGDAKTFFNGVFKQKVTELKKTKEFRDFISCMDQPDYHECCPFINTTNDKPVFNGLLRNIHNAPYGARTYLSDKNSKQVYGFAIEVTKTDVGRAIYFRKHTSAKMMTSSRATFLFNEGNIDVIKGEVLGFDEAVDCIYYELEKIEKSSTGGPSNSTPASPLTQSTANTQHLFTTPQNPLDVIENKGIYVLNIRDTEDLLALEELYLEKSNKAYDAMQATGQVDLRRDIFEAGIGEKSTIGAKSTAKKMVRLLDRDGISNAKFGEIKRICASRPDDFIIRIESGKLVVDSEDGFEEFLNLCNKYILRDIDSEALFSVKDPKVFVSKKKKNMATIQQTGKTKSRARS